MLPVGSLGFTPMLFSVPLRLRVSPKNSIQYAAIGGVHAGLVRPFFIPGLVPSQ